jgi:hypothetical protein
VLAVAAAVALAALAAPAAGESVPSARADDATAAVVKLLSDPTQQQQVVSAAGRSTVVLQNPCPTAQYSIEKKFIPYRPVSLDGTGQIVSGAWKQVVDQEGCGNKRVLNVLVWAQESKGLSTMPLLPGTTHADFVLQKDAVPYAVQALATVRGGREANCQVGYVADTQFVEQETTTLPGAKGPSWRELWTLESCTQKMLVPMHFIPDATGTSISAGPNTAIQVVPLSDALP